MLSANVSPPSRNVRYCFTSCESATAVASSTCDIADPSGELGELFFVHCDDVTYHGGRTTSGFAGRGLRARPRLRHRRGRPLAITATGAEERHRLLELLRLAAHFFSCARKLFR